MTLPTALYAANQAGSVTGIASGSYTGTGDAGVIPIKCGFVPRYVKLMNVTDCISYEWFEGMASTNTIKQVANGTSTLDTNSCILVGNKTVTSTQVAYPAPGAQTPDDGVNGTTTVTQVVPDRTLEPLSITGGASGANVNISAKVYAWVAVG